VKPESDTWRRRLAMVIILTIAALLFAAANFASSSWIAKRKQLAQQWTNTADSRIQQSRPKEAVIAYRNALAYSDDPAVRFRMSLAMMAAGNLAESEAYLLSLLTEDPGNAEYELALAHLAEREHNAAKAAAHYRAALLGKWESNPASHRLETSFELVQLLLKNKQPTEARATLISMTAEMPKDEATQAKIAHLFFDAGDANEATAIAQQILRSNPRNAEVRAFYAGLLLHSGDFKRSRDQFELASERGPLNVGSQAQFEVAKRAVALDPYERGLRAKDEAARLQLILNRVQQRLQNCASSSPDLPQAQQWMHTVTLRVLQDSPDIADQVVRFAAAAEQHLAGCSGQRPDDQAIQLIGKNQ
jgi:tetratricopeptide (TPR) repeat protein